MSGRNGPDNYGNGNNNYMKSSASEFLPHASYQAQNNEEDQEQHVQRQQQQQQQQQQQRPPPVTAKHLYNDSMSSFAPTQPLQYNEYNPNPPSTRDAYGSFINQRPSMSDLNSYNTYNNVFVNSSTATGSSRAHNAFPGNETNSQYHIPSISVTNALSDVILNSPKNLENWNNQQFNDDDYYYNNSNDMEHRVSSDSNMQGAYSMVDMNANILDHNTQNSAIMLNSNGLNNNGWNNADNSGWNNADSSGYMYNNDPEYNYVDQNGDDYQINTYLDRDGEMVDPYDMDVSANDRNLSVYKQQHENSGFGGNGEDISNIANRYSHINLGEYDEDEDNKVKDGNTFSNRIIDDVSTSSLTSSRNSRDVLIDNGTKENLVRRNTTVVKKFKLWMGNYIFDSPISKSLIRRYTTAVGNENSLSNEFKFMRYQAVTCEPNKLADENFTVRQLKYMIPRQTELLIVITMYNEDHVLLGRTLKGVMDNIKHMVRRTHSSVWGPDAWKKIVVCIVSDGRSKVNEKSLALLSSLGCYQDGFAKDEINEKKVSMHVYEHTTMMNITDVTETDLELECTSGTVPVQLLFCLKEQNKKKINSHRWALEGFAELLQPNIVTLLDAGTMPGKDSIYQLWTEFKNPQVGGACGEIRTDIGKFGKNLVNPLIASQNFEYKMSNILDKTTESNFGFITVLPGAFSAYRFSAVQGQPLEKYFYGEHMEGDETNIHFFSSNMYLAEDRILCFEIVTKKNCNWILKYCKSSFASTDVPERVPEFILQRRRWLNGSFFASVYSFCHFHRIWTSGHSIGRKIILNIEFLYLFYNTLLSWFSLSSFFLVFRILSLSIAVTYHSAFNVLSVVFFWLYGICVLSTFILSLGNKPKSTEYFYVLTFIFFAVLMVYMLFCSVYLSVKSFEGILDSGDTTFKSLFTTETFRDIVISLASTYILYLVSSIIYLQPWHMLTSFVQYILLSPSYINVLNIYAFCNVHDLSWGTKGAVAKPLGKINAKEDGTFKMEILISSEEIQADYNKYLTILKTPNDENKEADEPSFEEKKTGYYATFRSLVIIFWVLTNFGVIAAVLETGGIQEYLLLVPLKNGMNADTEVQAKPILPKNASWYLAIILWMVALNALMRFIGCSWYLIQRTLNKIFHW